jgi:hypothetical protein
LKKRKKEERSEKSVLFAETEKIADIFFYMWFNFCILDLFWSIEVEQKDFVVRRRHGVRAEDWREWSFAFCLA